MQHAAHARRLPASALQQVDLASPVGVDVVVNGSFSAASLTASNSGVSTLRISGAAAQSASLQNTGCAHACASRATRLRPSPASSPCRRRSGSILRAPSLIEFRRSNATSCVRAHSCPFWWLVVAHRAVWRSGSYMNAPAGFDTAASQHADPFLVMLMCNDQL